MTTLSESAIETWDNSRRRALRAVTELITEDESLLLNCLFEPCISHRLGLYLHTEFSEYDVDCEYDRMLAQSAQSPARWDLKGLDKTNLSQDIKALAIAIEAPSAQNIELFTEGRHKSARHFEKANEQLLLLKSPKKFARPDVIVHKRNSDRRNHLVIEIKLGSANKCRVPMDLAKLIEFTARPAFNYTFGLFLTLRSQNPHVQCALLFVKGHGYQLNPVDLKLQSEKAWYTHAPYDIQS